MRKRTYRHRVTCSECKREIDSDYSVQHAKLHPGKKAKFTAVHDKSQMQLNFFIKTKHDATPELPAAAVEASVAEPIQPTAIIGSALSTSAQTALLSETCESAVAVTELKLSDSSSSSDEEGELDAVEPQQPIVTVTSGSDLQMLLQDGPHQPLCDTYYPKKFGREQTKRDFNPQWFKVYPWLSYDTGSCCGSCFPCHVFLGNAKFQFRNWKKPERLLKHGQSKSHQLAMVKWLSYRASKTRETSVLQQLNDEHHRQVKENREYLRIIIECVIFTAQQNIAQRGHVEERTELAKISDINRGNFLELLHLRSRDIPWLGAKMKAQLKSHAQWTSPDIQNELIDIVATLVRSDITSRAKVSGPKSVIIDETADISRQEQVAVCLRFVYDGVITEPFVGFYDTASTDGESLFKLVKHVFQTLDLNLEELVGECFDGASNMSGAFRGLAARMKETSPQAIYIHCYAHLLNLALQDTMTHVEVLRNALGTIQSLYNLIESSPKRHALFQSVTLEGDSSSSLVTTLKSQSKTRWSCRWEAVKAIDGQLVRVITVLLQLMNERNSKTYTDSCALLNAVCDFNFVFGLSLLKLILSMTSNLSSYIQAKTMTVITARRTADMTVQTLIDCRSEDSFNALWDRTLVLSREVKDAIKDSRFCFKEAQQPRRKKTPKRLQALIGETGGGTEQEMITERDYYRVNAFYQSIDMIVAELKSRFDSNDQDILCALGDIVLNRSTDKNSYSVVSDHYGIDADLLECEKNLFTKFLNDRQSQFDDLEAKSPDGIVRILHRCDLNTVLPVFWRVACILAAIPATSCSAERAFSGLRRMKTYLRSTMGEERLSNLAVINIEREVANRVLESQMEEIINIFARRKNRNSMFF